MSHYIEKTLNIEHEPIFKPLSREIVVPRLSQMKKTTMFSEKEGQKKILRLMFFQLKNAQYQKLHRQNAIHMQKQFQQLKAKIINRARTQQKIEKHRKDYSIDKSPKFDLSEIVKMNPQKVDLMRKYRGTINRKLDVFKEVEKNYQNWYDRQKNSPVRAPIFSKMTYLLERVNKIDKQNENNKSQKKLKKRRPKTPKCNPSGVFIREQRYTAFKHGKSDLSLLS